MFFDNTDFLEFPKILSLKVVIVKVVLFFLARRLFPPGRSEKVCGGDCEGEDGAGQGCDL